MRYWPQLARVATYELLSDFMKNMRIVTWNCAGAFRRKWPLLADLRADLAVIQECEDPAMTEDVAYREWAKEHTWVGPTKNKGLGVFPRPGLSVTPVALDLGRLELFLPCLVDDQWPLLATWTRQANSPTFGYIGQAWKLLQAHSAFLKHLGAMMVGDLNSNARWDVWDRWWNHSDVVRELAAIGLQSAYHAHHGEAQGAEAAPTFYMQRKLAKPYHIDYAFTGPQWVVKNVVVGSPELWLQYSDHMPVVVDLDRTGSS